jgi:malate synthase
MTNRVTVGNLRVAQVLHDFITNEALPGTGVDPDSFWSGVDKVVADLTPKNQDLLARRDDLQAQIDKWHRAHVLEPVDPEAYKQFLTDIGYLLPEPADFTITTSGVDDEITSTAGPQLVVPILNARFALNAANARWGSLYDALYGTDVISEEDGAEKGSGYNKIRGDKVIAYARNFLDEVVPLAAGTWAEATGLKIDEGQLLVEYGDGLSSGLATPEQFVGYTGELGSRSGRCCWPTTGCTSRSWSTADSPIGSDRRRGHQGRRAGIRAHHDHGFRGLGRGGRCRRQGPRLPQLAGPEQGRPGRRGQQGRQDLHPRAQPGPHLHHSGRRG